MSRKSILKSLDVRISSRLGALAGLCGLAVSGVVGLASLKFLRSSARWLFKERAGVWYLFGSSCRFERSCEVKIIWVRVGGRLNGVGFGTKEQGGIGSKRKLNAISVLDAFDHVLNNIITQGDSKGLGRQAGILASRALQLQPAFGNLERVHTGGHHEPL